MEQVPKMFGEEGEPHKMPESLTDSLDIVAESKETTEQRKEKMPELCYRWLLARLEEGKASTLREIFVDEFYDALHRTENLPQWLENFFVVFDSYYDADKLPENTLNHILEDTSEHDKNKTEKEAVPEKTKDSRGWLTASSLYI